jgi:hypothetical protein
MALIRGGMRSHLRAPGIDHDELQTSFAGRIDRPEVVMDRKARKLAALHRHQRVRADSLGLFVPDKTNCSNMICSAGTRLVVVVRCATTRRSHHDHHRVTPVAEAMFRYLHGQAGSVENRGLQARVGALRTKTGA